MPIIPTLTQAQQDGLLLDNLILSTAEALNNLAATMARCNADFWSLTDERLATVLNTDIARTNAVFSANSALGLTINTMLDTLSLPQFSARAPLAPGRDLTANPDGTYAVVPKPEIPETLP